MGCVCGGLETSFEFKKMNSFDSEENSKLKVNKIKTINSWNVLWEDILSIIRSKHPDLIHLNETEFLERIKDEDKKCGDLIHCVFDIDHTIMVYKDLSYKYDRKRLGHEVTRDHKDDVIEGGIVDYYAEIKEILGDCYRDHIKEMRTLVLMDKHVVDVINMLKEIGVKITYVTSRPIGGEERTAKQLSALGIKDPDIICVGSKSKAKIFFKKKYSWNNHVMRDMTFIVVDDIPQNLFDFEKRKKNSYLFKYDHNFLRYD